MVLFSFLRVLYFFRANLKFGALVHSVTRVLGDIVPMVAFLLVITFGFSFALLVLLQQNLVKCVAKTAGGPKGRREDLLPPAITFYQALIDEVLVRRWFPRMLLFVRERFNMDAEVVLQELMTHGRLSSELLVQHAVATYSAER